MPTESVRQLLIATNELGITGMQDALEKIVAQRLDDSSFIEVAKLAHERSFSSLMKVCLSHFICEALLPYQLSHLYRHAWNSSLNIIATSVNQSNGSSYWAREGS